LVHAKKGKKITAKPLLNEVMGAKSKKREKKKPCYEAVGIWSHNPHEVGRRRAGGSNQ
jgi:hypothetical protein